MKKIVLALLLFIPLVNQINAQSWSTPGSGIGSNYYSSVNALATYNGELYAGGYFTSAGNMPANNIAKWNGTSWSPVANGTNGSVYAMCVLNGSLYVAGNFSTAGNIPANDIAKWDGNTWSNVGDPNCYTIKSLAVFNDELYAAGFFIFPGAPDGTSIAKWNGTNWSPVGNGVEPVINSTECLAVYNNELYVAGALIGGGGVAQSYSILKWNAINWNTIITMPSAITLDGALGDIYSMTVYNGELYVAGTFGMMIDTSSTSQIAKWNGFNWSTVGSGINPEAYSYGGDSDGSEYSFVRSLAVYNGSLYAGGRFDSCGTVATRNIAKWNGANWSALGEGVNGYVYNMIGTDTALFVGGWFNYVNGYLPANKIAEWSEIADTCNFPPSTPGIINGNDSVCNGTIQTYWINAANDATSYEWSLPQGWTGYSISNSISVTAGANGGIISVSANNSCGSSSQQTLTVVVNSIPSQPFLIMGNDSICEGSVQNYFAAPVQGATSYEWFVPVDWSGYSNTDSISIIAYGYSGSLSVSAYNDCGSSIQQVFPINVSLLPQTPDYIEGDFRVCKGTSHLYFISQVQDAIDYTWELPAGWAGSSVTDSIIIIAGNNSGTIYVKANNNCGSSFYQSIQISADSIPPKPGNITGDIYTYTNYWTYYSIDKVNGAKDYNWSAGEGIIERGLPRNYASAIWKKAGIYELIVKAINDCGISEEQKITVKVYDFDPDDPFAINIYPNPSNGAFSLNAKKIQDKLIRVEVLTTSGQTVYNSGNRPGLNNYTQFIDLKKLPQGAYIIKIIIGDKVFTRRIIKNQ